MAVIFPLDAKLLVDLEFSPSEDSTFFVSTFCCWVRDRDVTSFSFFTGAAFRLRDDDRDLERDEFLDLDDDLFVFFALRLFVKLWIALA